MKSIFAIINVKCEAFQPIIRHKEAYGRYKDLLHEIQIDWITVFWQFIIFLWSFDFHRCYGLYTQVRLDHTCWKDTHHTSTNVPTIILTIQEVTVVNGSPVTIPICGRSFRDRRWHHSDVGVQQSTAAFVDLADTAFYQRRFDFGIRQSRAQKIGVRLVPFQLQLLNSFKYINN